MFHLRCIKAAGIVVDGTPSPTTAFDISVLNYCIWHVHEAQACRYSLSATSAINGINQTLLKFPVTGIFSSSDGVLIATMTSFWPDELY
jgi:hypothetical protein